METFFTFAFGRFNTPQYFVDLIGSIEKEEDYRTLMELIVQTSGLEPSNFDNLAMALSILKSTESEFVTKTTDILLCQSVIDIKVLIEAIICCIFISKLLLCRTLISSISRKL